LVERGTEWILESKSELVALLSGVRRLPLKEAKILSEEHRAVLLVVIGHRRKRGVSKARVGEILGLEASSYLDELLSQGLIYCDPSRELNLDPFFERTSKLAVRRLKRELERRGTLGSSQSLHREDPCGGKRLGSFPE
jgi:hypothetical protein